MDSERKGKYALVGPTPHGNNWWAINDMKKMYAVATVQASFPDAEEVIRFAWAKIPDEK
jgi:uncharacterized Rossmann fold enzyme